MYNILFARNISFLALGTFVNGEHIFASCVGLKEIVPTKDSQQPIIQVVRDKQPIIVPGIGDIVTVKVTKLFTRQAIVEILCVGDQPLKISFQGKIRKEDIRQFDIDAVEIYRSFRPGDIVRASVISLGDQKSYYLSTAQNELGVILANSPAGNPLIPISWEQMQCPITKAIEYRKVAKIVTTTLAQTATIK